MSTEVTVAIIGVASAAVAIVPTTITAIATSRQGKRLNEQSAKLAETHQAVTVNHHSSATPTVLDRLDDVKQLVLLQNQRLSDHIDHAKQMDLRLLTVEETLRDAA